MRFFFALLLAAAAWSASAQPLQLSGPTLDGSTFNLQALRGRV